MLLHRGLPAAAPWSTHTSSSRRRPAAASRHVRAAAESQKQQKSKELVVGIDLGTTNSVVSCIKKGKPVCLPNKHGDTLTPSVVHFGPDGQPVVGKEAKKLAADTTYYSVKRLIGRAYSDPVVQEEQQRLAYKVSSDEDGSVILTCPHVSAGYLYPEEVSACVLSQLLEDAAAATGAEAISKAVITVPAYFSDEQREATITAGRLAGLEVVRLIREPVAAALAYGLNLEEEQVVLVFDLGGGTYDISLLEVGNGTVEVLSTGGDAYLGGDDWDALIVSWLKDTYLTPAGVDCSDPTIAGRLKGLAEYAKVQLSDNSEVTLRMPVGGPGGGPMSVTLTQAQLDSMSEGLFRRARLPLDQACWQAGVDLNEVLVEYQKTKERMARKGVPAWKQEMLKMEIRPKQRAAVSKVLLVGGATRMPAVRRFITNMTGLQPEVAEVDPDEAVALGAAIQAGILQGEVQDMMVMEQWQASLMRALAQMQLKSNPKAKQKVEQQYDLEGLGEGEEEEVQMVGEGGEGALGDPQEQQQQQPGLSRERPKGAKRRRKQK